MDQPRPFRFGLEVGGAASRQAWIATARKAEALGYATLLVADHLDRSLAPLSARGALAPLTALVAAAEATTTLRLGTLVLANDFRNPVLLAQEAATVDLLSDGRLELGLGTGYWPPDYAQSGMPLDGGGVRVQRFAEAVQIIKGLFADDPFTFEGRYYTVHGLNGLPKPLQRPHPPILIGGAGPRMLSLAAREADIVSVSLQMTADGGFDVASITADAIAQQVTWVRQAAGARFKALEFNYLVPFVAVTDQRRQAAERILRHIGIPPEVMSSEHFLESPAVLIGTVDQIVEALRERRERYGFSYIVVWEPMEPFAPVVARLAGT